MAGSLLFVHAHPDDESVLTGSVLAKARALDLTTVVAYGTRGDAGETNADLGGESLGERRVREAESACRDLGVDEVIWLPYDDSGMAGTETTANPAAFSNAAPAVAADVLGAMLRGREIAAVVGYDDNGTYGHPDHEQVHRVAHHFGRRRGVHWVFDATYNREYLAALPDADGSLDPGFAAAEADLTHFVEGEEWLESKLRALMHHQSQVPDDWDGEQPAIDGFRARFGTEWFIATSPTGAEDLGVLGELFEPKHRWVNPLG